MRRIYFYFLLTLQIAVIVIVTIQFERIDHRSESLFLKARIDYVYLPEEKREAEFFVEYSINQIPDETWSIEKELPYNKLVYVTVERDELLQKVTEVSLKKPKINEEENIVLIGKYQYEQPDGYHVVRYGYESFAMPSKSLMYTEGDLVRIHLLRGKWGQFKVDTVEKINQ